MDWRAAFFDYIKLPNLGKNTNGYLLKMISEKTVVNGMIEFGDEDDCQEDKLSCPFKNKVR